MNRLQPRTLWLWWAALSGGAASLALLNPPWLAGALAVVALLGLSILDIGRVPRRIREQRWEAIWYRREDHPFRRMARRAVGTVVLLAASIAGLAWPLPGHPRLQAVALVVALADITDSTSTFRRMQTQLAEEERIRSAPTPRQPEPGWSRTYHELWTEEPELPPGEADRWEAFVARAADAGHEAHDDLTQIDAWYETPPERR